MKTVNTSEATLRELTEDELKAVTGGGVSDISPSAKNQVCQSYYRCISAFDSGKSLVEIKAKCMRSFPCKE